MPVSLKQIRGEEDAPQSTPTRAPRRGGVSLKQITGRSASPQAAPAAPAPRREPPASSPRTTREQPETQQGGSLWDRVTRAVTSVMDQQVDYSEEHTKGVEKWAGPEGGNLKSGFQRSAAALDLTAANTAMLLHDFREYSREKQAKRAGRVFDPDDLDVVGEATAFFEENYRRRANELMELAEGNATDDVKGKVLQTLGGLPLSLMQAASFAKVAGPIVGFGALGGIGAADQGWEKSLEEAAKGAFLGSIFVMTGGASRLGGAAAVGGTAGALAGSHGDVVDRAIETLTMGGLRALTPGKRAAPQEMKPPTPAELAKAIRVELETREKLREMQPEGTELRDLEDMPGAERVSGQKPELAAEAKRTAAEERKALGRMLDQIRKERIPVGGRMSDTPVLNWIRDRGGVDPESPFGRELNEALGGQGTRIRGVFRSPDPTGRRAPPGERWDAIPREEAPLFQQRGTEGYVTEQEIIDGVRRDGTSDPVRTLEQMEATQRAQEPYQDIQRALDEAEIDLRQTSNAEAIRVLERRSREQEEARARQEPERFEEERVPIDEEELFRMTEDEPGANWAGAIEGEYDPVAVELGKGTQPLRRDVILAQFVKDMGQTIYQGGMRGRSRKILGFFKPRSKEMRIRDRNDLETVAHDMGHAVETRFPEVPARYETDPLINAELRSISSDRSSVQEGWGEFNRFWLTQPGRASQYAPKTEAMFMDLLRRNPDLEVAYMRAQKGMMDWLAQDSLTRARSKRGGPSEVGLEDMFDSEFARWRQSLIDDTYGLEKTEKWLGDGTLGAAEGSATKTAREMRSKFEVANGTLRYGIPEMQPDGSVVFKGPGMIEILNKGAKEGGNIRDLVDSMIGRRARELKERDLENNFAEDEIQGLESLRNPAYDAAGDAYQKWNQGILQFAVDRGVISQAAKDAMGQYFYIPFYREYRKGRMGTQRSAVPGDVRATHRIRGGTGNIRDPLETMSENAARLVDLAMTNEARLKVADLASVPGGGHFLTRIKRDDARIPILMKDAKDAFAQRYIEERASRLEKRLQEEGLDEAEIAGVVSERVNGKYWDREINEMWEGLGDSMMVWQRGLAPRGDKIMAALRDGKAEYYEIGDPLLWRSIQAFDRQPHTNPLMKALTMPKALVQYTITRTLPFMGANIGRDQIQGGIMGRRGYKPFLDGARGFHVRLADLDTYYNQVMKRGGQRWRQRVQEDRELYRSFVANGGGMGGLYSPELVGALTRRGLRIEGLKGEGGMRELVLDSPLRLKHALDEASMAFELSTRLGSFRRDIKAGVHPKEAAYEARDLTDFARRGDAESLRFFLDTAPFLSAAIQGLDRFAVGAIRDPAMRKKVWQRLGALALLSGLNAARNHGNPLYDNQSDASKDFYWHFFVPSLDYVTRMANGEGGPTNSELVKLINEGGLKEGTKAWDELQSRYTHLRFPKVWEIGTVATVAERTVDGILKGEPRDIARHSARAFMANMHLNPAPAALQPLGESIANKDFFTWQDITPQWLEKLPAEMRFTARTPRTLRAVGKATGMSPIEMDHWIQSFTNTWGSTALEMADWGLFGTPPDMISPDVNPLTRRFTRGEATAVKPKQDLYRVHRELSQVAAGMDFMKRQVGMAKGDQRAERIQAAMDYQAEHPELRYYSYVRNAVDLLRNTGSALVLVQGSESLDETQEIARRWVKGALGEAHLEHIQKSPAWKNSTLLKRLLIDKMRNYQNLAAHQAMGRLRAKQLEDSNNETTTSGNFAPGGPSGPAPGPAGRSSTLR